MRSPLFIGMLALLCSAAAASAARPPSSSGCAPFSTLQSRDGRVWEVSVLVCEARAEPSKLEIRERRPADPAQRLKQGLIW